MNSLFSTGGSRAANGDDSALRASCRSNLDEHTRLPAVVRMGSSADAATEMEAAKVFHAASGSYGLLTARLVPFPMFLSSLQ
jgi:hypothetical protein